MNVTLRPPVVICKCSHHKRQHWHTLHNPSGPCRVCDCEGFGPEDVCRCGHGVKAHSKGRCHEGDGCAELRIQ